MNNARMHFTRIGKGQPVLLVNGTYQRRESWEPVANLLEDVCECILFDFPNQNAPANKTDPDPSFDRPEMFEDYILDVIRTLSFEPEQLTVCGLSLGSSLLRSLHLRRGVNFRKLVLCGLHCPELYNFYKLFNKEYIDLLEADTVERYAGLIGFWFFSHKWLADTPSAHRMIKALFRKAFPEKASIAAIVRAMGGEFHRGPPGGKFRCPTVIATGEQDVLCPPRYMQGYAERSDALFRTVEGGHVFVFESPQATANLLREILEQDNL